MSAVPPNWITYSALLTLLVMKCDGRYIDLSSFCLFKSCSSPCHTPSQGCAYRLCPSHRCRNFLQGIQSNARWSGSRQHGPGAATIDLSASRLAWVLLRAMIESFDQCRYTQESRRVDDVDPNRPHPSTRFARSTMSEEPSPEEPEEPSAAWEERPAGR